ncbi:hypothetical protein [Paracraurococcus ruber]|uniref:Uncharacterized protein n=1 Tax=Paracraurococcus ruber TaxID=77675 RepID=A0ABS1CU88_9PROT|nr:hypothetical protein [Paracraurococcus ruber]MBK1658058.1 hypothetical protein [Paracraurococcus ruber]TDG34201.1 hypothetical protein E2C05_00130 [Paracraurococcus ruber]
MARPPKPRIDLDLPPLIDPVLRDYRALLSDDPAFRDADALKQLAARYAAARAVVAQLEHLLKIAADHGGQVDSKDLDDSLAHYRKAMALDLKEEPAADDEGDGG